LSHPQHNERSVISETSFWMRKKRIKLFQKRFLIFRLRIKNIHHIKLRIIDTGCLLK